VLHMSPMSQFRNPTRLISKDNDPETATSRIARPGLLPDDGNGG
jgi:hypothetical protein